jgi:adenylyltransferase/sulfurtransferase
LSRVCRKTRDKRRVESCSPALISVGMSLSDDEIDRYARHIVLREVGGTGQARL